MSKCIVGIDAAYRRTGVAFISIEGVLLQTTVIKPNIKLSGAEKLYQLRAAFDTLLEHYRPVAGVIEDYSLGSIHDIRRLAEASGVIKACCGGYKFPCAELAPMQLKLLAADHGHATKEEVAISMSKLYKTKLEAGDEADAVAAAHAARLLFKYAKPTKRGEAEVLVKFAQSKTRNKTSKVTLDQGF